MANDSPRCSEIVDIIWKRKRHKDVRCVLDADHVQSDYPVSRDHFAVVADRGAYWKHEDAEPSGPERRLTVWA